MRITLGTILPTRQLLRRADAHAARLAHQQAQIGARIPNATRRVVGGEVRYYLGETTYAVVSRVLEIRWFQVRPDGDHAIESPIRHPPAGKRP